MIINTNLNATNTLYQLHKNEAGTTSSLQKISSGMKINRASDNPSGSSISQRMQAQIDGLTTATTNAKNSNALIDTGYQALSTVNDILHSMRDEATTASNGTETDADRAQHQKVITSLKADIDRISSTTQYNTKNLLDGSLTAAKTLQGSVNVSNTVKAADIAATAGTNKAGNTVAVSAAAAGQTGTAFTYTAAAALADNTIIQAGFNDKFKITINGGTTVTATIAASTTAGYTKDQFVNALNSAVQTAVGATTWGNDFNKATFSLTSDGHIQAQTVSTGSSTTYNITLADPTQAPASSLMAMGYSAKATTITGTADLGTPITLNATAASDAMTVTLGSNTAVTVNLITDASLVAGTTYSISDLQTHLQSAFDLKMGQGAMTVSNDGHFLKLTSNVGTGTFSIGQTAAQGALNQLFGTGTGVQSMVAPTVTQAANTTTTGKNTVEAVTAGTYISQGVNDEFNIAIDGGAAQTITLKAGNYATQKDLVAEVNNEISANTNLVGKVTASLGSDNKITFTSNSTGSSSGVTISDPTAVAQSALGAIGYKGYAAGISGTVALEAGVDLATTATDRKMDVTLGLKTVTIDLSGETGINSVVAAAPPKSSRDAIVKGLQDQLDKAFGIGAVTVNTSTAPGGVDTLSISNNTRGTAFSIANGANTGATALFGGGKTATVSPTGVNVQTAGTDLVKSTLSNSSLLTTLADSDGNNLSLASGNVINVGGTQNGAQFSAQLTVSSTSTVADLLNSMRNLSQFQGATVSLDAASGNFKVTGTNGQTKDISNLKFTAQASTTDTTIVSNFNRVFGSFTQTQQAQNAAADNSLVMHIGANQGQTMNVDINAMNTQALRLSAIDVSTQSGAETAISVLSNAIETVSTEQAKLGAYEKRLNYAQSDLSATANNVSAAKSNILDVDTAAEMTNYQKYNVLQQAAQAMLAQANQQPQQVLQLLR